MVSCCCIYCGKFGSFLPPIFPWRISTWFDRSIAHCFVVCNLDWVWYKLCFAQCQVGINLYLCFKIILGSFEDRLNVLTSFVFPCLRRFSFKHINILAPCMKLRALNFSTQIINHIWPKPKGFPKVNLCGKWVLKYCQREKLLRQQKPLRWNRYYDHKIFRLSLMSTNHCFPISIATFKVLTIMIMWIELHTLGKNSSFCLQNSYCLKQKR